MRKQQKKELTQEEILQQQIKAAKRLLVCKKAEGDLIEFTKLMMPHPDDPDDAERSRYDAARHHRTIAAALQEVEAGRMPRLIITIGPRHGKLCADSTQVLTTEGWKTHGELRVGDYVFGPDGEPTKVVAVGEKSEANVAVTISNGDVIKVHRNHEWTVYFQPTCQWMTKETGYFLGDNKFNRPVLLSERVEGSRGFGLHYRLPIVHAPQFADVNLPMEPYAFGAWLGDGTSTKPWITHAANDNEVIERVTACGYPASRRYIHKTTGVISTVFGGSKPNVGSAFQRALRSIGVLGAKHIPECYFTSSVRQRLELLAGIIDTDGHVEKRTCRVRISCGMPRLANDIARLVRELGMRPCVTITAPCLSSSGIQGRVPVYQIGFQPNVEIPTVLPRKKITRLTRQRSCAIAKIEECEPEPGNCIQVEREDGLYLVGKNLTPTHNSQLCSKAFPAWFMGRDPYRQLIVASYSATMAEDFGREVRAYMQSPPYRQVFPRCELRKGGAASDRIQTTEGGIAAFVGAGGALTGRGADLLIVDDPIKDREEADSQTMREKQWEWFTSTAMTRLMGGMGKVVIIMTRWHEDDLVGRLTDPTNKCFNAEEAKQWKILHLPALATEDNDVMGRMKGEALWPNRITPEFLHSQRRISPKNFAALYQGSPTPDDGDFFKAQWLAEYKPGELPKNMRMYCASDHAISLAQTADLTCLIPAGVDENDTLWILPDVWWRRADSEDVVDAMLEMMQRHKPLVWWAEKGHISKAIGPFLRKRMQEEQIYCAIEEMTPAKDKMTRAQSIQGRMSMGKVRFPSFAPWWEAAKNQLLKFPQGKHDDMVDSISWLGIGLSRMIRPNQITPTKPKGPQVGTGAWVVQQAKLDQRRKVLAAATRGW